MIDGVTISGKSDFFTVPANGAVGPINIKFGEGARVPAGLSVTSASNALASIGATAQLTVTATLTDGTTQDMTARGSGTNYTVSNPAIITVSADGLVTAVRSGTAFVSVMNEVPWE